LISCYSFPGNNVWMVRIWVTLLMIYVSCKFCLKSKFRSVLGNYSKQNRQTDTKRPNQVPWWKYYTQSALMVYCFYSENAMSYHGPDYNFTLNLLWSQTHNTSELAICQVLL
jgi:hypothetical protein